MLRLLVALPLSAFLSAGLFMLMAWLVRAPNINSIDHQKLQAIDFIVTEQKQTASRRIRSVPEPPQHEQAPSIEPLNIAPRSINQSLSSIPIQPLGELAGVGVDVGMVDVAVATLAPVKMSHQAMPLYRVEPRYPAKARQHRAEGHVVIRFDIDENGVPIGLKIIEAQPKRLFDREALVALKQWRYQPKLVNGSATRQIGQTVKLEFRYPK